IKKLFLDAKPHMLGGQSLANELLVSKNIEKEKTPSIALLMSSWSPKTSRRRRQLRRRSWRLKTKKTKAKEEADLHLLDSLKWMKLNFSGQFDAMEERKDIYKSLVAAAGLSFADSNFISNIRKGRVIEKFLKTRGRSRSRSPRPSLHIKFLSMKDAKSYAEKNGMFFIETSAKTVDNINQLFKGRRCSPPPPESSSGNSCILKDMFGTNVAYETV
ncbi:hypothetical protein GIB67_017664, partial [Kingdonia uniflora]